MSKIIKKVLPAGAVSSVAGKIHSSGSFLPLSELWQQPSSGPDVPQREEDIQKQHEQIIAQAREEAERICKQAHQEGFAQGEQEGREAGLRSCAEKIEQLATLFRSIEAEVGKRNERYEQEILLLIKTLVERLVHHEVSLSERIIQACLREALQYVVENAQVKIHLHADDFQRLKKASLENPALLEGRNRIQLVENPGIGAGGCLLETDFGEVDASLESSKEKLFAEIDRLFLAQLEKDEVNREE